MILPVLKYPDPRLQLKAKNVDEVTPQIRELADDMVETMYARDGIGLAAPQVGHSIRLIVIDVSGPQERSDLMVLINPKLTLLGEQVDSTEGCLSVSDYTACVVRYSQVSVQAINLEGEPVTFEADGLKAICLQHECDHLDGKLFIDRISRLKRSMYDKKISKVHKHPA